jgi:peptide/nickel transport system permease protein
VAERLIPDADPGGAPKAARDRAAARTGRRLRLGGGVVVVLVVLLGALLLVGTMPGAFAPYDPLRQDLAARLAHPAARHWLGTDQYGRDVLSRLIWGGRISLAVGVVAVAIGSAGGVTVGVIAGYAGGTVDLVASRVIDAFLTVPTILLALALIAALGTGLPNVMVAVGVSIVPNFARLVRGAVLVVRDQEYVEAARALGGGMGTIIVRHVLPNVLSLVIVYATMSLPGAILAEASLSFLGVGVNPPTPSWGSMVSEGGAYLNSAPWLASAPGLTIMVTVIAVNLLGDVLRDALDPALRGSIH